MIVQNNPPDPVSWDTLVTGDAGAVMPGPWNCADAMSGNASAKTGTPNSFTISLIFLINVWVFRPFDDCLPSILLPKKQRKTA
jgi:hypothetical protein